MTSDAHKNGPSASPVPEKEGEATPEAAKVSGPMGILFPPDQSVWAEARRLVSDKNIRVESLAFCASQDPVIVIELLKTSNAMYFSGGRSPITSTETAIVRLGSDVVLDILEKMKDRHQIEDEDISHAFEIHRSRCKRTAILGRIFAEAIAKTLSDDCQAAALLSGVGEMLAVAHFKGDYVKLAEEHSRSGVNYRLAQDYKFDVERQGLNYLRRNGIPEALLFALDREGAPPRSKERAILKPICLAACEMVDAFDNNRWEKLAPGKTLPPKSSVRMLGISDMQYLKIYERASEYLYSVRALEEKNRQAAITAATVVESPQPPTVGSSDRDALQSEIQSIIGEATGKGPARTAPKAPPVEAKKQQTNVASVKEKFPDLENQFNLKPAGQPPKTVPRVKPSATPPPKPQATYQTPTSSKVVSSLSNVMDKAKTSEELLSNILQMLVDDGPFEKSAIIVVSKDRKNAIVVAARGPQIGSGQKLVLEDPLSPLAQCFSKVQSFGTKESAVSPWGSKTFAVAPLDADHDTPVALYADCGNNGSLSFEARRIFRNVVDILNQTLPTIPGGIPVELNM